MDRRSGTAGAAGPRPVGFRGDRGRRLIQVQWLRFPQMPDAVPSLMLVWSSLSCPDCGAPRLGRAARGGKGFPSAQELRGLERSVA